MIPAQHDPDFARLVGVIWDVLERQRFPARPDLRTPAGEASVNGPAWQRAEEIALAVVTIESAKALIELPVILDSLE